MVSSKRLEILLLLGETVEPLKRNSNALLVFGKPCLISKRMNIESPKRIPTDPTKRFKIAFLTGKRRKIDSPKIGRKTRLM